MTLFFVLVVLLAFGVISYLLITIARDLRADADNKEQHERQFRILDK